jgi:long-chain acyl-CoA synthetase
MMTAVIESDVRARIDARIAGKTLVDVLRDNSVAHGDAPAIVWKQQGEWRQLTWAQYRQVVLEATAGLVTLGLESGQVVAIQANNRPEHVVADLAAVHAGGTGVTFYGTLATEQITYIASDCRARVAVLENPGYLTRWEQARGQLPELGHVVLMEGADQYSDRQWILSWDELLARGRQLLAADPAVIDRRVGAIRPSDVATLIYTSGTTGFPKGVVFSHENVLWTTESVRLGFDLPSDLRLVSYLPMAHIAERMSSHYLGLWLACQVYYCPDLTEVVDYVIHARPQAFMAVPRVWEKFYARLHRRFAEDSRHRLILYAVHNGEALVRARQRGHMPLFRSILNRLFDRLVFSKVRDSLGMDQLTVAITTAAPTDPDLIVFFQALGIPLCELYGLSECTGPATSNRPHANRIGSSGYPLPGVEVKLGPDGEVLIRGGNVVSHYHNLPEESAQTFDEAGWLHTGDLGEIDGEFLTIVGRKKDIIITAAGKNVAPSQMETRLKQNPLIAHACIVGDRRPYLTALIALDPEEAPAWASSHGIEFVDPATFSSSSEVRAEIQRSVDEVNSHVSRVETIRKFFIVPQEWSPDNGEVTPSLKVRRAVVMDKYASAIHEMYGD